MLGLHYWVRLYSIYNFFIYFFKDIKLIKCVKDIYGVAKDLE